MLFILQQIKKIKKIIPILIPHTLKTIKKHIFKRISLENPLLVAMRTCKFSKETSNVYIKSE